MSYIKIYAHLVWATKNRFPYLDKSIRYEVFTHIRENAREKDIFLDTINGYTDHVHCLISLNAEMSMSKMVQLIKGESSFWINKNKLTTEKFEWQDEYLAVGVGDDKLEIVRNYIFNQEEHHTKITFQAEYDQFMKRYNFTVHKG